MLDLQDALGYKFFDDGWDPLIRASDARNAFLRPQIDSLTKVFRGVDPSRYAAIQDVLLAGKKSQWEVSKNVGLKKPEAAAVRKLTRWWGDLLNLKGKDLDQWFEAMGTYRKHNGDPGRAMPDWTAPASMAEFLDEVFDGRVVPGMDNALALAQDTLMAIGRKRFLQEPLAKAQALTRQITNHTTQPLDKSRFTSVAEKNAAIQANGLFSRFVDSIENAQDPSAMKLANFLTAQVKQWDSHLGKNSRLRIGKDVTPKDIERISTAYTSYLSGMAMSARAALAYRNLYQPLLGVSKIGFGNTLAGMAEALTPSGRAKVKKAGIFQSSRMWAVDEGMLTPGSGGILSRAGRRVLGTQRTLLSPYRGADGHNRASTYLGGRRAIEKNADLLRQGKVDEFLMESGVIHEHPVIQRRIMRHFENKTPEGWAQAVENAAHDWGVAHTDGTQWVYNRANAPQWMQSYMGKMFGQFGLWGVSFAEYMVQGTGGVSGLITSPIGAKLSGKNLSQLDKARIRFMSKYLLQRTAIGAAGAAIGLDVASYNQANTFDFEGSPTWQLVRDVVTLGMGGSQFDRSVALSNISRFAAQIPNPFGALTHDVYEAMEEPDPVIALALLLGFNVDTTRERMNAARRQAQQ